MKYIAYGSNMIENHMVHRCPDGRLIGVGHLPNHRLEFYRHATVEPDDTCVTGVPVAVWELSDADETRLDIYEGYPRYYTKREVTVQMQDGSQITGMVYIMKFIHEAPPYPAYYFGIREAYEKLGFISEIRTVLETAMKRAWDRTALQDK